jgi:hypothetical protein
MSWRRSGVKKSTGRCVPSIPDQKEDTVMSDLSLRKIIVEELEFKPDINASW